MQTALFYRVASSFFERLVREKEDEKCRIRAAKKRRRRLTVSIDGQDAI
ncbi:hypothetical protein [Bradyrhizobium sp. USDA 10063]